MRVKRVWSCLMSATNKGYLSLTMAMTTRSMTLQQVIDDEYWEDYEDWLEDGLVEEEEEYEEIDIMRGSYFREE